MRTQAIGIILNGVTGRMGTNQHLKRSIVAIMRQGGIPVSHDLALMPEPILTGRNPQKLERLAAEEGIARWSTDLDAVLGDGRYPVFFDASGTAQRVRFVSQALSAGKAVYCEKPIADNLGAALDLARQAERAGLKNGVVQDKLWLPGIRKFLAIKDQGFLGRILAVRGEFGYWVFTGEHADQAPQRPSWNYRKEDGGGVIMDMLCHWRYLIEGLYGPITGLTCLGATHLPERVDEQGARYRCTCEDAAYATFQLADGCVCHFNSSWCTRVRRDDLLTMQVDGTLGSAVVGLRKCWIQPASATPRLVWNPDLEQTLDFLADWHEVPDSGLYDNAFKVQWELFLRHVALDEPFPWTLRRGAQGVQLAELGQRSWAERRWVEVPALPA